MVINCYICSKKFYGRPSSVSKGNSKYCSKKCFDIWQRQNKKIGMISQRWNSVKRICKVCKVIFYRCPAKIALGRGIYCSKVCYSRGMIGLNKGRKLSKETIAKISGKNHYNWKGGVNYKYRKRFKTQDWKIIKKQVYTRDARLCQQCGKKCSYMDISCHHIIPWQISKDNSLFNLVTLCRSCHAKVERFGFTKLTKN